MGMNIEQESFSEADYAAFTNQVHTELEVLQKLINTPGFGQGQGSIGAELEFYIIDPKGDVLPINQTIAKSMDDPQLTVELNRFNLEYNLKPQMLEPDAFSTLENNMTKAWHALNRVASDFDGRIIPIGILPTLKRSDFDSSMMTDIARYRVLSSGLKRLRGGPFKINIGGDDPLYLTSYEMTLEGANTSFQFHWRVDPSDFVDYYNAIQLATPLVLALACNSPSFLGHMLWDETRISLFKQSIDIRTFEDSGWRHPARVTYGEGWLRNSAWELFAESCSIFPALIPVLSDEDARAAFNKGDIPQLNALKLHHGTSWPWNRGIYDHNDGGHLRIELRSMPAGPTVVDMMANAAFLLGLAEALKPEIAALIPALPFRYAEHNFYRAAKYGLDANLIWPSTTQNCLKEKSVVSIANKLLPRATEGLIKLGISEAEACRLMQTIKARIDASMTGARWQRTIVDAYKKGMPAVDAFHCMLERYIKEQQTGQPIAEWSTTL